MRWLKIILPAAILAGMCVYSLFELPCQVTFLSSCLRDPGAFDGQMVAATGCRVVAVNGSQFTVMQFGREAAVKGSIPGLEKGQYIDFTGRFHKEGWLELGKYHVSSRQSRLIKLGVSLIPLFILGYMLFVSFRRIRNSTEIFPQ